MSEPMTIDEINSGLNKLTEKFILDWIKLVDKFSSENELSPNHKLTTLMFSHLGIERKLSARIWSVSSKFMDEVVRIGKELRDSA